MVLKLVGTKCDLVKDDFEYEIRDAVSGQAVAQATFHSSDWCKMYYQGQCYVFNTYPKLIQKRELYAPYPVSSKMKKTFGFRILQDKETVGFYYSDALRCSGTDKLKRNIGITVFEYFGVTYILYHVGLPDDGSHYYCMVDQTGRTVGILERYTARKEDKSKAKIYVDDPAYLLIMLLTCVEEFVLVGTGNGMDRSAAKYTSRWDEEKRMFNADFIRLVKAKSGFTDD